MTKNVPAGSVVAGNPAYVIESIEQYQKKHQTNLDKSEKFGLETKYALLHDQEVQKTIIESCKNGLAYIK